MWKWISIVAQNGERILKLFVEIVNALLFSGHIEVNGNGLKLFL